MDIRRFVTLDVDSPDTREYRERLPHLRVPSCCSHHSFDDSVCTLEDVDSLIPFMPPYPVSIKGSFNPEVEIFRGYWMVSWFKKEFAERETLEAKERGVPPETILDEHLEDIPPGSQGLMLQPYWGPGLKMPEARGSMIGFGDVHTRAHIYRAIIEGIRYALLEGVEHIEYGSGQRLTGIMVSGGGSEGNSICQITADLFDRPSCGARRMRHLVSGLA